MDYYDLSSAIVGDEMTPLRFHEKEESAELLEARMGKITGSEFGKLVVKTKDRKGYTLSSGKGARDIIYQTVWERLLDKGHISDGLSRINTSARSTEHGHEYEAEAIQRYTEITGNEVDSTQVFIELDDYIGGTPDGYIGDDGIIEVKCPWRGGNHIESLLTGEIYNDDYLYQIQGYLWLTGRKWCDFVTYDPDLPKKIQLNIIRVDRDEQIIAGIQVVLEEVKNKVIEIENRFKHE